MSLLTHFKCNDNLATTNVIDATGNGHNATSSANTDTMSVLGKINEALEFSPTENATFDSGIDVKGNNFSLSVWFKADSVSGKRPIVGFEASGGTRLRVNDGVLEWAFWDGDTGAYLYSSTTILTGVWYHAVITRDLINGMKMYVNTVVEDSNAETGDPITLSSTDKLAKFEANHFSGAIDDVRIYDIVLNSDDVDNLWNGGNGTEDEVVGHINLILNETLTLSEAGVFQPSQERLFLNETLTLSDSSPLGEISSASRIIYHAPSTLYIITDTDPAILIVATIQSGDIPSFASYTFNASAETLKNAKDISINSTSDYIYVAGAEGQVMKIAISDVNSREQLDLEDSDNLINIDNYNSFNIAYNGTDDDDGEVITLDERTAKILSSDFRINRRLNYFLSSTVNYIKAKILDTKFNFLAIQTQAIKSDFRFTTAPDPSVIEPMPRSDWTIEIDDVEVTDVDLNSIDLVYNIDQELTEATFSLARYHDSPNLTLAGVSSQITNNNKVVIKLKNLIIYDGKISKLNLLLGGKGTEKIGVTSLANADTVNAITLVGSVHATWQAIRDYYKKINLIDTEVEIKEEKEGDKILTRISPGDEIDTASLTTKLTNARNTFKSNKVNLPLAQKTVRRHVYDVTLNDIDVDNTLPEANAKNTDKFQGIRIDTGYDEFEWVHITGTPPATGIFGQPGSAQGNDPINLDVLIGLLGHQPEIFELINLGLFQPDPDYTYFWTVSADKYVTDEEGNTKITTLTEAYIGTSLDPLTSDNWVLSDARFRKQRIDNNWILPTQGWEEQGGGTNENPVRNRPGERGTLIPKTLYFAGDAPFGDTSSDNGGYFPKPTFVDREDGLYMETRSGFNYKRYAELVADNELEKLKDIHGNLSPKTNATIEMTLDAYLYYTLGLLTQVNLVNTTEEGVFKNNNGFALAIKYINLNSNRMLASLSTDNQKAKIDLDILDSALPNPNEYKYPSYSFKRANKINPATNKQVE